MGAFYFLEKLKKTKKNSKTKLFWALSSFIFEFFNKKNKKPKKLNLKNSNKKMSNNYLYFCVLATILVCTSACGGGETKSRPEKETNQTSEKKMSTETQKTLYDFKLKSLDGKSDVDFSTFKGKKVLLVNVASKCGFTGQYEDLQKLHTQYGEKLVVIGVPANNFGGQEPGTSEEIATFCKKNYGVSFQITEKISVIGDDQHALYKWLSNKSENGWNDDKPSWNFNKYLVNEKGELIKYYPSKVKPLDESITKAI